MFENFSKESFESQKYYWEQWWNTAGQGHDDYDEFVQLRNGLLLSHWSNCLIGQDFSTWMAIESTSANLKSNKAARENGFTDTGDMWRLRYEGKL